MNTSAATASATPKAAAVKGWVTRTTRKKRITNAMGSLPILVRVAAGAPRFTHGPHPCGDSTALMAAPLRVAKVSLEGVITDVQLAACMPFVAAASLEDKPRVAAAPRPHRITCGNRGSQHLTVLSTDIRRQIVQLEPIRFRERDGPLDEPFQLTDVARPVVDTQRVQRAIGHGQTA